MPMAEMPILTRRRIEAEFAKGIYAEMVHEFGAEAAKRVLARAVIAMAREAARGFAEAAPEGASLAHFRAIQSLWRAEDALTIEEIPAAPDEFHFNVTRCRYAEMYRERGLGELGALLSCQRDAAFCEGYHPALTLARTQTLMQGATHCDFRYRWEGAPAADEA
jgi:hypothetical protein